MGDSEKTKREIYTQDSGEIFESRVEYFLEHFEEIRVIHDYIVFQTEKKDIGVINSYNMEIVEKLKNRIIGGFSARFTERCSELSLDSR